jgi:hypothetical protein
MSNLRRSGQGWTGRRAEELRLVLQQIDDIERRGLPVEVIKLYRVAGILEPLLDALALRIEGSYAHLAERCAVVREGAVAERRAGDGREPAVEEGEVLSQGSDYRELILGEAVHDLPRVGQILLLHVVVRDETIHAGHARIALISVEDLLIDSGKGVVGIEG